MKHTRRRWFLFFFILIFFTTVRAQVAQPPVNTYSPTPFSFQQYGKIASSGNTGAAQVNIPLFNFEYKDFKMPIVLNYNSTGVRVNQLPGNVGVNWSLNIGGAITRQIRGLPDEFAFTYYYPNFSYYPGGIYNNGFLNNDAPSLDNFENYKMSNNFQPFGKRIWANCQGYSYYRIPQNPIPYIGQYHDGGCSASSTPLEENMAFWYSGDPALIDQWSTTGIKDYLPDEFSFNFLDITGSFRFNKLGGSQILVKSNRNLKIEKFTDDLDVPFIPIEPVHSGNPMDGQDGVFLSMYNDWSPWYANGKYPKTISGFIITDDRGIKYYFGKSNTMLDDPSPLYPSPQYYDNTSIEYSITNSQTAGINTQFNHAKDFWKADVWHLTRVVLPDNRKLNFSYTRGENTFSVNKSIHSIDYGLSISPFNSSYKFTTEERSPVYLSNILSSDLLYINLISTMQPLNQESNIVLSGALNGNSSKYNQLDKISCWSKLSLSKAIEFTYQYDPGHRPFLHEVIDNTGSLLNNKYQLEYNNISQLPLFNCYTTDHWGFYNNITTSFIDINTFSTKETNPQYLKLGALTKLIYPTKGYTEFEYEANVVSKIMKNKSNEGTYNPTNSNYIVGGLRVNKIFNCDGINPRKLFKQYYYSEGYSNQLNAAQLIALNSSGILSYKPAYQWYSLVPHSTEVYLHDAQIGAGAPYLESRELNNKPISIFSDQPVYVLQEPYHVSYSTVVEKTQMDLI